MAVQEVWVVWVRCQFVEWSGGLRSGLQVSAAKLQATSGVLKIRHMLLPLWWRGDVSHVAVKGPVKQAEVNGGSLPLITRLQYKILQAKSFHGALKNTDLSEVSEMSFLRLHTSTLSLSARPHVQAAAAACLQDRQTPAIQFCNNDLAQHFKQTYRCRPISSNKCIIRSIDCSRI